MVFQILMVSAAFGWPNKLVHTEDLSAAVEDVVASSDEAYVSILHADGLSILSLDDWSLLEVAPCPSVGGVARDPTNPSGFAVGCGDGSLMKIDGSSGRWVSESISGSFSEEAIVALASNSTTVFGVVENPIAGAKPLLAAYNTDTGAVVSGGFPAFVWHQTIHDLAASDQYAVVTHGGRNVTEVTAATGAATQQLMTPAETDASDLVRLGTGRFLVAGGEAGVLEFQTDSNALVEQISADDGLSSATAVGINPSQTLLAVGDELAGSVAFYPLDPANQSPLRAREGQTGLPSDGLSVREFGWVDGYLIAGTDEGFVHLLSDRPWVEVTRSIPRNVVNGDEVAITFTSDTEGTWTVRRGATGNEDGRLIDQGRIDADGVVTASIPIDDGFIEGANILRIVVEDAEGRMGHDITTVDVDNPPSMVAVGSGDLGFGDGRLIVSLNGIPDADLSHYMVFVSSTEFSRDDYDTAGPSFVGVEGDQTGLRLELPRRVAAEPGENKTVTIQPLTNGATYFVAVRAYDAAGQEGPMSNVVSESPRETFGASDLAGESGGHACSTSTGLAGWTLAFGACLMAAARRRSGAVAVLLVAGMSSPAMGSDSEWPQSGSGWSDFLGGSFEARYSSLDLSDESLTEVFGDEGHNALWIEIGPTVFDLVEITGALGYYSETGKRVDADGNQSAEDDTMLAIPLTVDATFRLDVLPEQLIVPFVGYGYDYWLWQESWTGGNSVQGGKSGTHTTLGAHVLLDLFQPSRASRLEASSGITDTFITVEYRQQTVGDDSNGLSFSADVISVGLKLDY